MNEIQGKSILVRVSREGSSYRESTGFLVNYNEPIATLLVLNFAGFYFRDFKRQV